MDGVVPRRRVRPAVPQGRPGPESTAERAPASVDEDTLVLDAVTPAGHAPVDGADRR